MRRRGADHRGVATFNYYGFVLAATGIVRSPGSHTHSRRNLCCGNDRSRMMEKFIDEMFVMVLLAVVAAVSIYAYDVTTIHTAPIATGMNPD